MSLRFAAPPLEPQTLPPPDEPVEVSGGTPSSCFETLLRLI